MVSKQNNERFKSALALSAILIFCMILLSAMIGFLKKGFDTGYILNLFSHYGVLGLAGIIVILLLYAYEVLTPKDDNKYGNSLGFDNTNEKTYIPFDIIKNKWHLLLGSIILFGFLGLFISFQGQAFTGEVLAEQQFTPGGEIIYKFFLIPIAENAALGGFLAMGIFGLRYYARKVKMNKALFSALFIISLILLSAFVGLANHELRYGDTDIIRVKVFLFWGLGGLITGLTGSIIPFLVMHSMSNLLYDLSKYFQNDFVQILIIGVLLTLSAILLISVLKKKSKN